MNISLYDYDLLRFISKNPDLTEKEICAKAKNCNEYRIALLWRGKCIRNTKESDENWVDAQYVITNVGDTAIQDFRAYKKMLWLEKAKIPILVTIATYLIISGIEWSLPRLLQLLS